MEPVQVEQIQKSLQPSEMQDHSDPVRTGHPPADQLIDGAGDDQGCLGYLFNKIIDFFLRLFCYTSSPLSNSDGEEDIEVEEALKPEAAAPIQQEWADRSKWAVKVENISITAPALVLPKDDQLKKISVNKIKEFIVTSLQDKDRRPASQSLNNLINASRDPKLADLLKYLRAIVYKFQTGSLPEDKKLEICMRLGQALLVCQPTWIAVAKTICQELYIDSKNVRLEEKLLQLVEKCKSDLLVEVFVKVTRENENYKGFDWNIISMVRNEYGQELGVDQSSSQHDSSYQKSKRAPQCALEIRDAFLEEYKNVHTVVHGVHREIVAGKLTFFDDLVQIIEAKTGMGNLKAKQYVSSELFDMDEGGLGIVMKEETVYLLLQTIGVVV